MVDTFPRWKYGIKISIEIISKLTPQIMCERKKYLFQKKTRNLKKPHGKRNLYNIFTSKFVAFRIKKTIIFVKWHR